MIKEKTSYLALDPKKEEKDWATGNARQDGKTVEYTLPDGQKLKVLPRAPYTSRFKLTVFRRLVPRDSERPRFSLILKSLVSNIPVSTRLLLMPSAVPTWT